MCKYKVYLDSTHFACKSNGIITSKMYRYLVQNGHEITHEKGEADYSIISTCGFHEGWADLTIEVINILLENCKPNMKIITIGCLNKIDSDRLKEFGNKVIILDKSTNRELNGRHDNSYIKGMDVEKLDSIFMNSIAYQDLKGEFLTEEIKIDSGIANHHKSDPGFLDKTARRLYHHVLNRPYSKKILDEFLAKDKVFIEISRGCVGQCSYCIIKKARGNVVSRSTSEILNDIRLVYESGKSLFLVSDDCASYGVDIKSDFPQLLMKINNEFPNIPIDINYINPFFLMKQEEKYLEVFRKLNIRFAHISMQSGSNRMIKLMNRHYDVKSIKNFIKKINKISPQTILTTSIIVGHPNEKFTDFLKTLSIIRYFDFNAIFPYSDRANTKSSLMENKNSSFSIGIKAKIARIYALSRVLLSIHLDIIGIGKSRRFTKI